jgi:hypothetical protein
VVVTAGRTQRLTLTTCGDTTNVDTQLSAFIGTVAAPRAAFNDDDPSCGGRGGASTLEVDVRGGPRGRLVFFSAAHGEPLDSSDESVYELLLVCDDLDHHQDHQEDPQDFEGSAAADGFSPAVYDSTSEGAESYGAAAGAAVRAHLKARPSDDAPFAPEAFAAPAEWSSSELGARAAASAHPAKPPDYMTSAVDLDGPEFRNLDQSFRTGYAYTPTFENSSQVCVCENILARDT